MKDSTFASYGLDIECNMLQAPKCECGCGQYANLVLEDDTDINGFMVTMLEEFDCEHCGIFAVKTDGDVWMGLKIGGETHCYVAEAIDGYEVTKAEIQESIATMQKELQLHCYGLIEQVGDNLYSIVMD